jgi:hypothetical protein
MSTDDFSSSIPVHHSAGMQTLPYAYYSVVGEVTVTKLLRRETSYFFLCLVTVSFLLM